ncbi:MAG: hypothetical protein GX567_06695 [Clostridia bacterium]|nr:hypothetical protein [Clostridia bacterium]
MKKNLKHNFITQALSQESEKITASDDLKHRIDATLDEELSGQRKRTIKQLEGFNMNHHKILKVAAVIAAICILVPTGVYATGQITGYMSSMRLDEEFESYTQLAKAQEKLGFSFDSIENFSNGYLFSQMGITYTDKMDDSGSRVSTFPEWFCYYEREGSPKAYISVHETQPEYVERPAKDEQIINGIHVRYYRDHYKMVPVDYELTDEDEANMLSEDYFISVGTQEIEEKEISFIEWEKDNLNYLIMINDTDMSTDELFEMASEIIK